MRIIGEQGPLGKLLDWDLGKNMYTQQQWYTPAEVAVHNTATDCWVSLNGKVYNLTPWLEQQFKLCRCVKNCSCPVKSWYCSHDCVEYCNCFKRGYRYCDAKRPAMTVLAYAGKDVSGWFEGGEWRMRTYPVTGNRVPYMRHGAGHRQPEVPSTRWRPLGLPWWRNEKLVIGNLTAKTRPLRITNTLTQSTITIEVCSEETIYQIMMRYMPYNRHYHSYTFRYQGKALCYNRTLEENGIPDERELFSDIGLPDNLYIPALLVYFNDDHTEDFPVAEECFCHK